MGYRIKTTNKHDVVNGFNFTELFIETSFLGKITNTEWDHFLWNVNIKHSDKKGFYTLQYRTGLGHIMPKRDRYSEEIPLKPEPAMILHSLLLDSEAANQSFNDWCAEFGFDSDSIKAFNTYQECCKCAEQLSMCFTKDQLATMREALRDF